MEHAEWDKAKEYQRGDQVTHGGVVWELVCKGALGPQPGSDLTVWGFAPTGGQAEASELRSQQAHSSGGSTSDDALAQVVKTIKEAGYRAASELLTEEKFLVKFIREKKAEADAHIKSVWKEKVAKFEGNYSYTKAAHHANEALLRDLVTESKTRAGLAEMDLGIQRARICDLEDRLAAIEGNTLKYCGVWEESKAYQRGDTVTWKGCMWHCKETTFTSPEFDGECWQLVVKRGRDGKDLR